jgi:hypothetical protein
MPNASCLHSSPPGIKNQKRGFAVAADRIYYLKQADDGTTDLRRFMLASHEDSLIAALGNEVYLGLDISPDGKSVIYSQMRLASNLMSVEPFR